MHGDSSKHIKTAELRHRRTIANELFSHFFCGTVTWLLKNACAKLRSQLITDNNYENTEKNMHAACYQCLVHLAERQVKIYKNDR